MSAFKEAIAREVRRVMLDPEFTSRQSKNGGRIFWVKKAAATGFAKFVKEHPAYEDGKAAVYTTMSEAAAAVVADRGDEARVTEGHTEEFEKAFCLSTSGVRWVGEGSGTKVPTLTISGAIHGVAIEAAGVEFENFRFAAPPITGALSMLRIKGAGCKVKDIAGLGAGASTTFVDCIRVVAGANDLDLINVKLTGGIANKAPDSFLTFENSVSRFYGAGFYATGSVGVAGVRDAASAYVRNSYLKDFRIAVRGSARPAITLDADVDGIDVMGIVEDCSFAGTSTTLATNAAIRGGWRLFDVKVLEETGSKAQGALIPAVDVD